MMSGRRHLWLWTNKAKFLFQLSMCYSKIRRSYTQQLILQGSGFFSNWLSSFNVSSSIFSSRTWEPYRRKDTILSFGHLSGIRQPVHCLNCLFFTLTLVRWCSSMLLKRMFMQGKGNNHSSSGSILSNISSSMFGSFDLLYSVFPRKLKTYLISWQLNNGVSFIAFSFTGTESINSTAVGYLASIYIRATLPYQSIFQSYRWINLRQIDKILDSFIQRN